MTETGRSHDLDLVLSLLEDEILSAPDRELVESDQRQGVGLEATRIVASVLAGRLARRRPGATADLAGRVTTRRREWVQKLLVANPRARDIAGATEVRMLSDGEFDALLERLAGSGLLPPEDA